jgi:hypothetical protein
MFFDGGDWDHYTYLRGTFWGLFGSLWLIEIDLSSFISSPRIRRGRGGYGGFVYLRFTIGGCPEVAFLAPKKIDQYD